MRLLTIFLAGALGPACTAFATGDAAARALSPFAPSYVAIKIARNYPQSFSLGSYGPGEYHPAFGFRHSLGPDWMMGVGAQYRLFDRVETPGAPRLSRTLAMLTLYHEALYALRLDHPTYLLLGPRLTYLVPTRSGTFPVQRDPKLAAEVGVGLAAMLARHVTDKVMITLEVERWRGTRTMRLNGLEAALGANYAL